MPGSRAVWGIVAGGVLAVVAVWVLASEEGVDGPPGSSPSDAPATPSELASLRVELEAERERNLELSTEVEWLQAQLDFLSGRNAPEADAEPESEDDLTATPEAETASGQRGREAEILFGPAAGEGDEEPGLWFHEDELESAGLRPHEVERLQDLFNSSEMQLIDLEHQARREGWYRKPRYWQSLRQMRNELREEAGEEDYDLLLYATGRMNRVVIDGVLRDSPGDQAGLEPGDVVLSYEGRRIYKAPELKRATIQGQVGDRVTIDVLRDGERVRVYALRGPLGARLRPERILPLIR